jgi:diadenosine tetraphosphate (Ap4A) HIT family hydrolase
MDELPAHETVRRAREKEQSSPDGRLPLPGYVSWATFPYEGELRVRPVADVVLPEPPRGGAGGVDCVACDRPDDSYLWTNADWRVSSTKEPSGLPVVLLLEPRAHADLHDLPAGLVAQLGVMLWRIEAALTSLGGVGRVQMARWGDGGEHLHWWFLVRPLGLVQARGSFLADWDDILPARPRQEWVDDLGRVAEALAQSEPSG